MPDYAALDTLVARLRSSNWTEPNDLAQIMASTISAIVKQPTFNRGLHDNTIADQHGGTLLSTSDNSAGRQSSSLQVPAKMHLQKHGAVSTRQQARVDIQIKSVPAVVLGAGTDGVVQVALVGSQPKSYTDPLSGQMVAGDPIGDAYTDPVDLDGTSNVTETTLAGNPFILTDVDGTELPARGQTTMVTVAEQSEKRTIWVNHNRRNFPRVTSQPVSSSTTMVNGLCCHHEGDGTPPGGS